jgi:hypothetical protein
MNVVINQSEWKQEDIEVLFGDEDVVFSDATDIPALVKELGVYRSTTQARQAGRVGPIPTGFTELKASKKRFLWIWNPTE